jgi:DNA-binding IclR family transcriptional regulator
VTIPPQTTLPLHAGALGKALLAFAPAEIVDEVIAAVSGPNHGGVDADRLRRDLADIVTSGIARSVGEGTSGVVEIAVPVFREEGIVAAIGVVGPETRGGLAWRTRVARLLPGAASSIVGALGPGLSDQDFHASG